MELGHPVVRARQQERAYFVARVIEYVRAPFLVHAAPRIGMLIERGAIEARERECVGRKMAGHPVDQHTDPGLVKRIDQRAQIEVRSFLLSSAHYWMSE